MATNGHAADGQITVGAKDDVLWRRQFEPDKYAVPAIELEIKNTADVQRDMTYREDIAADVSLSDVGLHDGDGRRDNWSKRESVDGTVTVIFEAAVTPGEQFTTIVGLRPGSICDPSVLESSTSGALESGVESDASANDDRPAPDGEAGVFEYEADNADEPQDDADDGLSDDTIVRSTRSNDDSGRSPEELSRQVQFRVDVDNRINAMRREQEDRAELERQQREQSISEMQSEFDDLREENEALRGEIDDLRAEMQALKDFRDRISGAFS